MMSPQDAAFHLAHDYPGGAAALALRMGRNYTTLVHELKGTGTAKLGLGDAVKMSVLTGNPAIAQAFAVAAGGVFLPAAAAQADASGDLAALARSAQEFGEFAAAFAAGLADGRVTGNELARVNTEALEAIRAIVAALARAQALHDADPMRAAAEAGKSVPVRRVA